MSDQGYKILFIAPSDSGLDVAPEIDSIAELGFKARALQGKVTPERIFAAVRQANYDILHFACHADHSGIVLSDGIVFDTDSILQVARMARAKLVFLNACQTSVIGQTLIDENVPAAIVMMRDVPDNIAKQTAQAFYKHLALTGDLHEAYRSSKPASRGLYQWLSNGGYQRMIIQPLLDRLDRLFETHCRDTDENNRQHEQFRQQIVILDEGINLLRANTERLREQRIWFFRVTVGAVIVVSVVQSILLWVAR